MVTLPAFVGKVLATLHSKKNIVLAVLILLSHNVAREFGCHILAATSYKWHTGEGKWIYCSRMLGDLGVPNMSVPPSSSTAEDVDGPVVLPQPSRAHEAGAQGSYGPEVAVARNIPLLPISSYHIMFVCQFTTVYSAHSTHLGRNDCTRLLVMIQC